MASPRSGVGSPCRAIRPSQQAGDEVPPCRAAGGLDAGHSRAQGSSAPAVSPRLPLNLPRSASGLGTAARFPRGRPAFPQSSLCEWKPKPVTGPATPGTDQPRSVEGAPEGAVHSAAERLRVQPQSNSPWPVQGLRCCPFPQAQLWI